MKTLGKYEVLEELGSGAMGKVFHGRDRVLQREVAIKTIGTEDADVELKQRFYREARACGRLSHPNIVTVFDLGEQQGTSYIAMEYLEGEDLRKFIDRKTFMPLEGKIQIMSEVADGLAHAHDNRIVHRDIKPSNIFLLKSGRPKLLDFGIARVFASQLTRVGYALGTPEYMAPEQIKGKETDARSDIFSAAVVFFELLAFEHPFGPSDIPRRIIQDPAKSLRSLNPLIPEKLEQILLRAMNKEPAERYQTAAEFAKALRKLSFEILGACARMTDEALKNRQRILDSLSTISKAGKSADGIDAGIAGKLTPEMAQTTNTNLHYFSLSAISQEMARTADALAAFVKEKVVEAPKTREMGSDHPTAAGPATIAVTTAKANPELETVRKRVETLFGEDIDKCLAEIEILPPDMANDSVIDSYWVRALSARSAQQATIAAAKVQTPAPKPQVMQAAAQEQTLPRTPVETFKEQIERPTVVAGLPETPEPEFVSPEPPKAVAAGLALNPKLIAGIGAAAILLIVILVYSFSGRRAPSQEPKPVASTTAAPEQSAPVVQPAPAPSFVPPQEKPVPQQQRKAPEITPKQQDTQKTTVKQAPKPTITPPLPAAADLTQDLAAARQAFVEEKYDAAVGLCDKILAAEPANKLATELRQRALNAKKLEEQLRGK
jgi:serine/threonine protein kinase